jgi:starvation-inducible DNA-binding protein
MAKKPSINSHKASAQPRYHQSARELQAFGTVTATLPLQLEEPVRLEMTEQLNQLLADTMTLRDLYKKSHWQVAGATFYQLHLLFDKHHEEQSELVDTIAERIQLLGGISIAMAADVAETTRIPRPPKGREEVPVQLSRVNLPNAPINLATPGPTTWWSVMYSGLANCRSGFSVNISLKHHLSKPRI